MQLYNKHFNQGQTALSTSAISRAELHHPLIHWARHLLLHVSLVSSCKLYLWKNWNDLQPLIYFQLCPCPLFINDAQGNQESTQ